MNNSISGFDGNFSGEPFDDIDIDIDFWDKLIDEVSSEDLVLPESEISLTNVNEMALDKDNGHEDHNYYYHTSGDDCNEQYVIDAHIHSDDLEAPSSDYDALDKSSTPQQYAVAVPTDEERPSRKRKGSNGDEPLNYVPIHTMFLCACDRTYMISGVSDVIPTSFQSESSSSTPTNLTDQHSPDVASHLDPKKRRLTKRRDAAVFRRAKTKAANEKNDLLIACMVNRAKALTHEQRDTLPGRLSRLINGESCDVEFFGGFCEEDGEKLEKCSDELRELKSALEDAEKCVVKMENRLVLKRKKRKRKD